MTKFQATEFHKKIISWVHGPTNTSTNKYTGNFLVNYSVTKIHREFHSCIIMHTVSITNNNSVFNTGFFLVTALQVKLHKTTTRGLLSM